MKNFFLTLDLEEWYHLDYFNDLNETDKKDVFIFKLIVKKTVKLFIFFDEVT